MHNPTILGLLFLFLSSCCNQNCPEWKINKICHPCSSFSFAKMYLPCLSVPGVEAEFNYGKEGLTFFLNFHYSPLVVICGEQEIAVTIITESFEYEEQAYLLKGNQRLLFTQKAAELIAQALLANEIVTIQIGSLSIDLPFDQFIYSFSSLIAEI